jgi:hypothetical protein
METAPNGKPKVKVELVGADGNCFAIMGKVAAAMRAAGWSPEDRDAYLREAKAGNYDHLLQVTLQYAENIRREPEEDAENWGEDLGDDGNWKQ